MKFFRSFKDAVESVKDVADRWMSVSEEGISFTREEMLVMGQLYDEACKPDEFSCFGTFENSGEICRVAPVTGTITVLYAPEGSRYRECIEEQEKRVDGIKEHFDPVFREMIVEAGEKAAIKKGAAMSYSIDAAGLVTGPEPDKLSRARRLRKPGFSVLPQNTGTKAFDVYKDICAASEDSSKHEQPVSEKKAESDAEFVWEKLYGFVADEADEFFNIGEIPGFEPDDQTDMRIRNGLQTLHRIRAL